MNESEMLDMLKEVEKMLKEDYDEMTDRQYQQHQKKMRRISHMQALVENALEDRVLAAHEAAHGTESCPCSEKVA